MYASYQSGLPGICIKFFIIGILFRDISHAQTYNINNTNFTRETFLSLNRMSIYGDLVDDDRAEIEKTLTLTQGNIFYPQPGKKLSYWDGMVVQLSVEASITANPWTRSGRNFAQFFADRANTFTLNQILGSLSHPVTNIGNGYGFGFTIEQMYGSDARFNPTIGMGDGALTGLYQWVPNQTHVDFHMPWLFRRGIDVQVGQMYGLMGAEGLGALSRPFYTYNYASDYIMPFEVLGIYTTLHLDKNIDWILGIDAGNSTGLGRAGNNNRPKGTFGFRFRNFLNGNLDYHIIGHFGPQGNNGQSRCFENMCSIGVGKIANEKMQENIDILASYRMNEKLSIRFNSTWMHDDLLRNDAYGVTFYMAWKINHNLQLNARGEIFRDNTGGQIVQYASYTSLTRALSNKPFFYYNALPTTYGDLTVGVNYRPDFINRHISLGTFTIRPEIRLDKSLNGTRPFNLSGTLQDPVVNNGTNNMLWFSVDAIWNL